MTDHGSTRRQSRLANKPEDAAPDQPSLGAPAEGGSSTSRRAVQAGADYRPGLSRSPGDENAACDNVANRSAASASSVGTSRRVVLPSDKENLETQPTVITKTPSLAQYPISGLHPRDMGRLLEGERLGHYELLEYVGGGGMGAVFRSHDTMLNRTVAVKVLSQEQSSDEETLRRFQNEAQSAARLDHENISRVHYVGEDRGWHYIVFEFIEGINLRDSVGQRGPLPLFDAVSYTLQISDALMHASRRDVVHRDIKPSNVLITPDGRAKLVDMGLARMHQVEPQGNDLTASGVTLGTFDYISPEQARDPRSADVRSDIYSLGCTLYFMLTARPPFPDGTVLQKLLQHQGDEPPDVRVVRRDLPDDFLAILNRMLAKSPDARFQTPADLVGELTVFASRHGLQPAATGSVVWLAPAPVALTFWERHLPWMAPLAILLVVVAVMSQIWSRGGDHSQPPPLQTAGRAVSGAPATGTERNVIGPKSAPLHGASKTMESKPELDANRDRPLPQNGSDAPTSQIAEDDATAEHNPTVHNNGRPSIIRSTTNGLMQSIAEWQNQMTDLVRTGLRSEELKHWWPDNRSAPPAAETQASTNHTLSSNSAASHQVNEAQSSKSGPAVQSTNSGVLVVGGNQSTTGEFASVAAACEAAKTGDVIELRFNGRIEERPFRLGNLNLTIRAADGYQPVVRFHPQEQLATETGRSAIIVGGGNLSLLGLAIEFDVPRDLPADDWTIFELRQPEAVRLESCVLTIRNTTASGATLHPDVTFFRVRPSTVAATPLSGEKGSRSVRTSTVVLQLRNSFARGAATFLEAEPTLPLSVQWDNGILVTNQRMLSVKGVADSPPADGAVKIDLRHVTVLARLGLLQMIATGDVPYLPPVEMNVSDSIFLTDPKSPFVLQTADDELEQLRRRLTWKGDRTFYEGVATFWRAANTENFEEFQANQWQTFWGNRDQHPHFSENWQSLLLAQDERTDLQRLAPADFRLRPGENPARRGSSDGRDAGCQVDLLPAVAEPMRAELP